MQESRKHRLASDYTYGYAWYPSEEYTLNYNPMYYDVLDTRQGESLLGYRDIIKRGDNATTPFLGTKFRLVVLEPFDWSCKRNWPYLWKEMGKGYLPVPFPSDPAGIDTSVADNLARRKAIQRIYDKRTSFLGSSVAAEVLDTIRMLKNPARGLRQGLDTYHRDAKKRLSRLKNPRQKQRMLAETWLEYQFGWKPLISDIESAVENLQKIRFHLIPFKASAQSQYLASMVDSSVGGTSCSLNFRTYMFCQGTVTYRGAIRLETPTQFSLESWGFSTQDFLPAVWEAIPYSFVFDYFTNIGDIISAFSSVLGNVSWVGKTVRKKVTASSRGLYLDTQAFFSLGTKIYENVGSLGNTTTTRSSVVRSPVSEYELIPTLSFHIPSVGSLKWLNLAALVRLKTL